MRKWSPFKNHPNIYTYQTAKGKRFAVRRGFTNVLGKKDEFTKSGFKNWHDADVELKNFESDLARGVYGAITAKKVTVNDYWTKMVKRKLELHIWKESTHKNVRNYYNKYLKPSFGNTYLDDVTRSKFQAFLDELSKKDYAKNTIKTITSIMLNIMNEAEREDVIDKNKLRGLLIGGKNPKDLTIETNQYELWLNTAKTILDKYMLALVYVNSLGMRKGELMGLRTTSLTFKKTNNNAEICAIKLDLQRTADYQTGTGLKTASSYRTIWVQGHIVEMLHFAILTADNLRLRNNIDETKDEFKPWLWLNDDGEPLHPNHPNRVMGKIEKKSGVHVTPHMLRHYFATQAMASKAQDIEVMHWLGHKNIQMTADYTRVTETESLQTYASVDRQLHALDGTNAKI